MTERSRVREQERRGDKRENCYWGNNLTILMLHAPSSDTLIFWSAAACPSEREASNILANKTNSPLSLPDCTERMSCKMSPLFSLLLFVFTVQTAHAQLRASLASFQRPWIPGFSSSFDGGYFCKVAAHENTLHRGSTQETSEVSSSQV